MINKTFLALSVVFAVNGNVYSNNFVPEPSPFSFTTPIEANHPKQQPLLAGYFDIKQGAKVGSKVMGRIQPIANYQAPEFKSSERYSLRLKGKTYGFELKESEDNQGRLFGELIVHDSKSTENLATFDLTVELLQQDRVLASQPLSIHVVEVTTWEKIATNFLDYIEQHTRLGKRYQLKGAKLKKLVKYINANQGKQDLGIYQGVRSGWFSHMKVKNITKQFEKANRNIGALGYAYNHDELYQSSSSKAKLRDTMYQAIIALNDTFPYKSLETQEYLNHSSSTHQWRFTDGIAGAFGYIALDMYNDIEGGNTKAILAQQALSNYLSTINFALLPKYRDYQYPRYFQQDLRNLAKSNGAFSDANRHHRQRSWLANAVMNMDYNRPLTYQDYWYDGFEQFGKRNTRVFPAWTPKGSFFDIKTWLDTNASLSHRYGQSGLLPDGSVSHHIGKGQDMAHVAYGFEWQATGVTDAANVLYGTPFAVDKVPLESQRSFLLNSYPWLVYKNIIDFQTVGRSHYSDLVMTFGNGKLLEAVEDNLEVKSDSVLAFTEELEAFKKALEEGESLASGVYPVWINDFIVTRNEKPETEHYYISVKLQSNRTVGAEGFKGSGDNGFHNGSGVMQLKTYGDEYGFANRGFDWHALPGTTEELKDDAIPLSSKYKEYNPNAFSGVNSLAETNAVAAFDYDRLDPYASSSASKAWFITDNQVVALGNRIKRRKFGQGRSIVTTVDQAKWYGDLSYFVNGRQHKISYGDSKNITVSSSEPIWFHQGDKGYLILPTGSVDVLLRTAGAVNRTEARDKFLQGVAKEDLTLFQISIDHGVKPRADKYSYIAVAGISKQDMPQLVEVVSNFEIINQDKVLAVHNPSKELYQIVFKQQGQVKFSDGMTVESDQPAIVQLSKLGGEWSLSVTDPLARIDLKAINLIVDQNLPAGEYRYRTKGVEQKYIEGQKVLVSKYGDKSRIHVSLPDYNDNIAYGLRAELYTGMPAEVVLTK